MPALVGTCWADGAWTSDAWAANTWAAAEEAPVGGARSAHRGRYMQAQGGRRVYRSWMSLILFLIPFHL